MRLIDADKLDSYIKEKIGSMAEYELFATMIDNQPIAYSSDKVIEQLRSKAWHTKTIQMPRYEAGKRDAYYDAIEIVKGGGQGE